MSQDNLPPSNPPVVENTTPSIVSDNIKNPQTIPHINAVEADIIEAPKKNPVGRPTKLNMLAIMKAEQYYRNCLKPRVTKDGKTIRRTPFIEELALELDVDDSTLINWAEDRDEKGNRTNPEFFATYKKIKTLQKLSLLNRTLGQNPTGAIFQLKANHGMMETEKQVLVADRDVKVSITRE